MAPVGEPAFSVDNVSKYYVRRIGGRRARHCVLNRFSARLLPGEVVALLGPSGSGKSSLLRILTGNEKIDEGQVAVFGGGALEHARSGKTSLISSDNSLLPWRTALENVRLPLDLLNQPREDASAAAERLLEQVRLSRGLWNSFPHELSEGQRQRVRMVQAFSTDPDLLLMDEPFSNCDEALRRTLVRFTADYLSQDPRRAAVIVTHHVHEAAVLGDRILIFRDDIRPPLPADTAAQELHPYPDVYEIIPPIPPSDRDKSYVFQLAEELSEALSAVKTPPSTAAGHA